VLGVCLDTDPFGFPALVTTATGRPLDRELHGLGEAAQARIVTSVARAVAALHGLAPQELGIAQSYDPASVLRTWQCDAAWYENHADQAGATADVVRAAALVLAGRAQAPSAGCVVHRDLTPYNILAGDGTFAALVDWDHAGFSARQEDVGKAVIGLLGMLAIPRERRIPLASTFLRSYAGASSLPDEELYEQCVPFALDTILDWIVGGKNAPREELAWATEQVMNAEGIQQRNRRRPR
jgi:aminoglycoside phosphotransferase (APT) family kinase protein